MYFSDYQNHQSVQIRSSLLWEYAIDDVDYDSMKTVIVQRVVERGRTEDFYAILNRFGLEEVRNTIKEIAYLSDKDIAFVCTKFNLNRNELKCYSKQQLRNQHWNS